ncbi:hypothetical protein KGY14_05240 [Ameyamaea chiangmaiensis]|uniref:Uncharacterized protein n=1 Tax=Ameyamaea chiangmaiensis TaxID=442969 RepID=A0A850P9J0_9PROT|nr:hypothetical protein [Ameyamaea chiangmaiensis]MBS4074593.1 hypothetical protein [Ameyamaea chiangmaiensis]NVN39349.1 hypothetical protein [Ameyamaea chiangmaiensis]
MSAPISISITRTKNGYTVSAYNPAYDSRDIMVAETEARMLKIVREWSKEVSK